MEIMDQPCLVALEAGTDTPEPRVRFTVMRFPCVVGRHPDCDRCLDLRLISRHHCRFFVRSGMVWVEDLASRHGTYVNGKQVRDARPLFDGDSLALGYLLLRVSLLDGPGAEHTPEAAKWRTAEARPQGALHPYSANTVVAGKTISGGSP
jgi:pSer/pThr/pTyr-binding forkhead associated (FHA) protein